ncbi:MAG: methylmalonyl-CoA mutase small subunit [Muribaculaceae bacterium]|nr:methylmalonyl-CoA mutase small subunit [Muribaculaceae bacterium]
MATKEKLFDMFSPTSTHDWIEKITVDLKGADFEKKLVWRTNEGFNVQPFYRREDLKDIPHMGTLPGQFPYVRGTKEDNNWLIRQQISGNSPEELNKEALDAIEKGVDSLGIRVPNEVTKEYFETLFKDVDLKKIEVNILGCMGHTLEVAQVFVDYLKSKGLEKDFHGSINYNPFKRLLNHGLDFPRDIKEEGLKLYEIVKDIENLKCFAVDSVMLNAAGAYISQELGYALAWGAEWMTLLTDGGLTPCEVAGRIKFNMGISSNYFMEIAKFRAARMLWAEVVKAYDADDECCKMHVHATTSFYNMTIYDAHVNLLRSMTETMSAAIAGVDSLETLPFDITYKAPDEFSKRIAKNQQLLLRDESHINKVVDPAGGSYYVEVLTKSIAEVAWKIFVDVEEKGGFLELLKKGEIQKVVNESGVKRHNEVARRKEILLGTNQYPNFNEKALDKIEIPLSPANCGCKMEVADNAVDYLNYDRAASQFEQLRLDTERSGKRPKVFMLTIGNLAMRLARAQFSANFFGCAGYEIIDNIGFDTIKEGVDAAIEKKADVVVLCSSDDEYAQYAPEAFKELDGRAMFVVAGAPACMDELKAQGIEEFIHVRVNVLDTLIQFNAKLLK